MENITDKIKSIRETVGHNYVKPSIETLDRYFTALHDSSHPHALTYLRDTRGLSIETITHFQLGYDEVRNAIAIPLFKKGVLINFKYRLLSGELRYTSESGCEHWMFNEGAMTVAKEKGAILIVEGEFDCMRVWQEGIKNVISPSSGKDSYGLWIAEIDPLKRIYIAYDNDEGGRSSAYKMAERLGVERTYEVRYTKGKDACEEVAAGGDIRAIIKASQPFTSRQFKSLGDIISSMRSEDRDEVVSEFIPKVGFKKGWMAIISGKSNVGKTGYVLNIADEMTKRGIPTLIMPFERGIESVGERFLSVMSNKTSNDFSLFTNNDWKGLVDDASGRPLYFAMPNKEDVAEFMVKSKRYFDTKIIIVDHLDYLVRQVTSSRGDAISDTLQQLKKVAEDNGLILLIVSHIRKTEAPGQFIAKTKKPNIEDLKGSSSLYQDPEVVVMLSQSLNDDEIEVDVLKNKGEMGTGLYHFNRATGKFGLLSASNEGPSLEKLWNETE